MTAFHDRDRFAHPDGEPLDEPNAGIDDVADPGIGL